MPYKLPIKLYSPTQAMLVNLYLFHREHDFLGIREEEYDALKNKLTIFQFKSRFLSSQAGRHAFNYVPLVEELVEEVDSVPSSCPALSDFLRVYSQLRNEKENNIVRGRITIVPLGLVKKNGNHLNTLVIDDRADPVKIFILEPKSTNFAHSRKRIPRLLLNCFPTGKIKVVDVGTQSLLDVTSCGAHHINFTQLIAYLQVRTRLSFMSMARRLPFTRLAARQYDDFIIDTMLKLQQEFETNTSSSSADSSPHVKFNIPSEKEEATIDEFIVVSEEVTQGNKQAVRECCFSLEFNQFLKQKLSKPDLEARVKKLKLIGKLYSHERSQQIFSYSSNQSARIIEAINKLHEVGVGGLDEVVAKIENKISDFMHDNSNINRRLYAILTTIENNDRNMNNCDWLTEGMAKLICEHFYESTSSHLACTVTASEEAMIEILESVDELNILNGQKAMQHYLNDPRNHHNKLIQSVLAIRSECTEQKSPDRETDGWLTPKKLKEISRLYKSQCKLNGCIQRFFNVADPLNEQELIQIIDRSLGGINKLPNNTTHPDIRRREINRIIEPVAQIIEADGYLLKGQGRLHSILRNVLEMPRNVALTLSKEEQTRIMISIGFK